MFRNTDCIKAIFPKKNKYTINDSNWDDDNKIMKYKFENHPDDKEIIPKLANYTKKTTYEKKDGEWVKHENWDVIKQTIKPAKIAGCDDKVVKPKGLHINGRAGTGKTTIINNIIKYLDENDIKYIALAPTNKAARKIKGSVKGQTFHKYCACYFNNRESLYDRMRDVSVVFVDEISMVTEIFYKVMISIKRMFPRIIFVIAGDFCQLEPVKDRYQGDYENSRALKEICDYNLLHLTKCMRADQEMFNICLNVENVKEGDFSSNETMKNLAYTNKTRKIINTKCMSAYVKKKKLSPLRLPKLPYDKNSQAVELLAGMPIIARVSDKDLEVMNNESFVIKMINKKKSEIVLADEEREVVVPIDDFQKVFYVAFCITVHRSQGDTYNEAYTIYEWEKFSDRMKYVALSRTTDNKFVNIII